MATTTQITLFTDDDLHWFNEGRHLRLFDKLGSRPWKHDGVEGVYFSVWAPNAHQVHVMGDFNHWSRTAHPLSSRANSGIWEGFVPHLRPGTHYKYYIRSRSRGYKVDKADPYSYHNEESPKTASSSRFRRAG